MPERLLRVASQISIAVYRAEGDNAIDASSREFTPSPLQWMLWRKTHDNGYERIHGT